MHLQHHRTQSGVDSVAHHQSFLHVARLDALNQLCFISVIPA